MTMRPHFFLRWVVLVDAAGEVEGFAVLREVPEDDFAHERDRGIQGCCLRQTSRELAA